MLRWLGILLITSGIYTETLEASVFEPLEDLSIAPPAIQRAARSVVRIQAVGPVGTGIIGSAVFVEFADAQGVKKKRLLTPEHLVGSENCSQQGCIVTIDNDYEKNLSWNHSKEVFLKPTPDRFPDLDAALYQVFEVSRQGEQLNEYLDHPAIRFARGGEKIGNLVHVVGFPSGALMKSHYGDVIAKSGDRYDAKICVVKGNSGSAVLNEEGELDGMVDKAPDTASQIYTFKAAQCVASFVSAQAILKRIMDQNPEKSRQSLGSLADLGERFEVNNNDTSKRFPLYRLLLSRRVPFITVLREGISEVKNLGWLLHELCKKETIRFENSDNLKVPLDYCSMSFDWINCNNPEDGAYYKFCPKDDAKEGEWGWKNLYQRIARKQQQMNVESYRWAVLAPSLLEGSKVEARKARRLSLSEYLKKNEFPYLGEEILAFAESALSNEDMILGDENLIDKLINFEANQNYAWQGAFWSEATTELSKERFLNPVQRTTFVEKFMKGPFPILYKLIFQASIYRVERHELRPPSFPNIRLP